MKFGITWLFFALLLVAGVVAVFSNRRPTVFIQSLLAPIDIHSYFSTIETIGASSDDPSDLSPDDFAKVMQLAEGICANLNSQLAENGRWEIANAAYDNFYGSRYFNRLYVVRVEALPANLPNDNVSDFELIFVTINEAIYLPLDDKQFVDINRTLSADPRIYPVREAPK